MYIFAQTQSIYDDEFKLMYLFYLLIFMIEMTPTKIHNYSTGTMKCLMLITEHQNMNRIQIGKYAAIRLVNQGISQNIFDLEVKQFVSFNFFPAILN